MGCLARSVVYLLVGIVASNVVKGPADVLAVVVIGVGLFLASRAVARAYGWVAG